MTGYVDYIIVVASAAFTAVVVYRSIRRMKDTRRIYYEDYLRRRSEREAEKSEKRKRSLRQFLYLDQYKAYSLYSQMFEGLTDYLVYYSESGEGDKEYQRGPSDSGRLLVNLASSRTSQQEGKFLHDYAFTLFEEELETQEKLLTWDLREDDPSTLPLNPGSIVKVKGSAIFNDVEAVCSLLDEFDRLGKALGYVSKAGTKLQLQGLLEDTGNLPSGEKEAMRSRIRKMIHGIESTIDNPAFSLDCRFRKDLKSLLEFGFRNLFELQLFPIEQDYDGAFVSAMLKRDCLREEPSDLAMRYSRLVQGEVCLLGVVSQIGSLTSPEVQEGLSLEEDGSSDSVLESDSQELNLRRALGEMIPKVMGVEEGFIGCLSTEVVVDPLAVYREIGEPAHPD